MKKIATLFSILFIVICSFSQTNQKKEWSSATRQDFIRECIKNATAALSADTARFYCYCMQEKMEAKYPDTLEAAKVTAEELAKPEWKKEIAECLYGSWSKKDRNEFINSCREQAKSLGSERAKNYCECMQFKMEKIFPDVNDAAKLTGEDLKSEYWQKIIKNCLNF